MLRVLHGLVEPGKGEAGVVRGAQLVIPGGALDRPLRLRGGCQVARGRVAVDLSVARRVCREGLPDDAMRERRGDSGARCRDADIDPVRRASDAVVDVVCVANKTRQELRVWAKVRTGPASERGGRAAVRNSLPRMTKVQPRTPTVTLEKLARAVRSSHCFRKPRPPVKWLPPQ